MSDPSIEATELGGEPLPWASTAIHGDRGASKDSDDSGGSDGSEDSGHPRDADDDSIAGDPGPAPSRGVPDRVGRYLVLRKLGAGAMGMVVVAYDPELDRQLAIKLVHPRVARRGEARTRMLREAKGLARLSHPNVVQIYDAGTLEGRVFIAMELVDGEPLSAWTQTHERSADQILAVFLEAGRGLAAAHDAGLVHRDFKPDNVLVDRNGRARVLDFGLVRAAGEPDRDPPSERSPAGTIASSSASAGSSESAASPASPASASSPASPASPHALVDTFESAPLGVGLQDSGPLGSSASGPSRSGQSTSELELELTHGGQIMGTPAYMSPEQWRGSKADARSDQFSFCVALWEALYGERPFRGESIPALAAAVDAGRISEPQSAVRLPRRVRAALERGLAVAPDQRFPSMAALLGELGPGDSPGRSLLLAGVALLGFGVLAWARFAAAPTTPAPTCDAAPASITAAWGDDQRGALRAAFAGTELASADAARIRVEAELDDYAARWSAAAIENCAATRIRQQQSEQLLDLRGRCLETKATEFAALVDVLTRADADTVDQAVLAVESLPSLRACEPDQVASASEWIPDDAELAAQVTASRASLAKVRASLDTGRYSEAGERLTAIELDVEALGYAPLTAELAVEQGRLHARLDRYEQAGESLQRGYFLATRLRNHELALTTAVWLAELEGAQRQRPEFAELWAAQAEALLAQHPGRYPDVAADLADTSSWNAYLRNDLDAARTQAERGLAILDEAQLEAPMRRLALLLDRGAAEYGAGDLGAAETSFEAALALAEATVGRDNAKATGALNNLAFTYMAEAELDRARALLDEAVTTRERALGPNNATVGSSLSNLADVELERGDGPAALAAAERAHAILTATAGPDQFVTVVARQRFGLALALVGRLDEAVVELRATREIAQTPPPDPSLTIELTGQISAVEAARGDLDAAEAELETVANSDPSLWSELVAAGRFAVTLGQGDTAIVLLTRAIDLAGGPADAGSRRRLAQAKLALAGLLESRDPARGAALLADLDDDLRGVPKLAAELEQRRETLDRALASHNE